MWDRIEQFVRQIVSGMLAQYGQHRYATVVGVNPDGSHTVKVSFQPEGVLSGWLPMMTSQIGLAHLPREGDQVVVAPIEGSIASGIVIGAVHSDTQRAPLGKAGESWSVNQTKDSYVIIANDGNVTIAGNVTVFVKGPTLNVEASTAVNINAPAINFNPPGSPAVDPEFA